MNKNFKPWKNERIKDLFNFVENGKKEFKSLIEIFDEYAKNSNTKKNSIRNYYYNQIEYFNLHPEFAKQLNINLEIHKAKNISHFTTENEMELIKKIEELLVNGYSVRKACLTLANNDVNIMMRLQNKYRNYLTKQKLKVKKADILQFKPKIEQELTDSDINNLFLGLVKVIKKNAVKQVKKQLINECEWANSTLRKTLVTLNNKEQTIQALNLKNTMLSKKLIDLTEEIARLTMLSKQQK